MNTLDFRLHLKDRQNCQILRSNLAQRKLSLIVDQKKIHIHLQLLDEHDILNQNYVFLRIF